MAEVQTNEIRKSSIAPATGVGKVHLSVTDAARSLEFYRDVLGLVELPGDGQQIRLGAGRKELVVLHPGAAGPVAPRTTGLYHLALVVPSRRDLARVIARLISLGYPNSPTDHVMTKSDYLWDPDGNGIEIYTETPEDGSWFMSEREFGARTASGAVRSGRDPIDLESLFRELRPEDRLDAFMPEGTKMGHVHLHVRDIDEAVHFYSDLIGFDVMGLSHGFGAAFVSAGGYHHHIGLNTWAGQGAPPPPHGVAGLRQFTIELPTKDDLLEVIGRLEAGAVTPEESAEGFFVADPSANRAQLAVRSSLTARV